MTIDQINFDKITALFKSSDPKNRLVALQLLDGMEAHQVYAKHLMAQERLNIEGKVFFVYQGPKDNDHLDEFYSYWDNLLIGDGIFHIRHRARNKTNKRIRVKTFCCLSELIELQYNYEPVNLAETITLLILITESTYEVWLKEKWDKPHLDTLLKQIDCVNQESEDELKNRYIHQLGPEDFSAPKTPRDQLLEITNIVSRSKSPIKYHLLTPDTNQPDNLILNISMSRFTPKKTQKTNAENK